MQMITWFLLPTLVLQFLLSISPVLPIAASVPTTILFLCLSLCSAYFGYKACSIDPIDPRLCSTNNDTTSTTNDIIEGDTKYCWVCETRVGVKSMHCKFCNKCVDTFDHHCQWLNTCIGKKNYQYFYKAVVSTALFVMVHMITSLILSFLYFYDVGSIKESSDSLYGIDMAVNVYFVIVFGIVTLGSSLLVGQLWFFHFNLRKNQMTTYSYIIEDNGKRREKYRSKMALKRQRTIAKNNAIRDGERWMYIRLSVSEKLKIIDPLGCCIPCDPIQSKNDQKTKDNNLEAAESGETRTDNVGVNQTDQVGTNDNIRDSINNGSEKGFTNNVGNTTEANSTTSNVNQPELAISAISPPMYENDVNTVQNDNGPSENEPINDTIQSDPPILSALDAKIESKDSDVETVDINDPVYQIANEIRTETERKEHNDNKSDPNRISETKIDT